MRNILHNAAFYFTKDEISRRMPPCIYKNDFGGYTSMSVIADRIVADTKYEEQCKKVKTNYKW